MKIIDILNKIANKEVVPKQIKYGNSIFKETSPLYYENEDGQMFEEYIVLEDLNDEVEILDEDKKDNFTGWKMYQDGKEVCSIKGLKKENKIEKIDLGILNTQKEKNRAFKDTINLIIDYINKEE